MIVGINFDETLLIDEKLLILLIHKRNLLPRKRIG